ncbi:MAG: hypothetical protein HY673_19440 [Chloroflexi bacterium]|nr:hypothetical protein [Chloroflexota bacterium]
MQGDTFGVLRALWLAVAWGVPAVILGLLAVFIVGFPLLTLAGAFLRIRAALRRKAIEARAASEARP